MTRREEGFTLIEVTVAVGLFGIIMIGMSLLFRSAFQTTGESRTRQLGKAVAQERLEEVRSLPYYEPRRVTAAPVDVLDRYFPDLTAANHSTPTGATGSYKVNGVDGTAGNADDATFLSTQSVTQPNAPPFTLTVAAQFVTAQSNGTLTVSAPPATYSSTTPDLDRPATDTLKVIVNVAYTERGIARNVTLDTLVARVKQQAPKLEASGSISAVNTSGVAFQDGDIAGVAAEIVAEVGVASSSFREVTESSSQASSVPLRVTERRTDNSVGVQPVLPSSGSSSASVPNSSTGSTQSATNFLAGGSMASTKTPTATIASWCTGEDDNCSSSAEARVSTNHAQIPEGKATFQAGTFQLNARDPLEAASHRVLTTGTVAGSIDQRSTTSDSRVDSTTTVNNLKVWGSTSFVANPRYEGTVIMDRLTVTVGSVASATTSSNSVVWEVRNLRVWDPNKINVGGTIGGYGTSYNFGFNSGCGQWVGTPPGELGHTCGPSFENPNPVVIPTAYSGVSGGQAATSLSIVTGATVQEKSSDPGQGIGNASTSQKSVITIITREDVTGAAALEPSISSLGSATATVSYVQHAH